MAVRPNTSDSKAVFGNRLNPLYAGLVAQFLFELVSGLILSSVYRSSAPYETDHRLHDSALRLVQGYHYWQSSLLILESVAFLVMLAWKGSLIKENRTTFFSSLLIFSCSMGFQLTGNALPFDHHAVQTAVIESSIAARVPLIGPQISHQLLAGDQFSMSSVPTWYRIHLLLTLLSLLAVALAFRTRGALGQYSAKLVAAAVFPAILVSLFVASPLGGKAGAADFNSYSDKASWYTWPLHGALTLFSRINPSAGWLGAILVPTLLGIWLVALPWFKPPRANLAGKAWCLVSIGLFGFAAIFYGGSIDPLTGTRDPAIVANQLPSGNTPPIDHALASKGRALINSQGCANCHGQDGLQAKGGPSLKNVQNRHSVSSYFETYIKNPQSIDPNSTMPAFPQLTPEQLREIAEYLRSPGKPGA